MPRSRKTNENFMVIGLGRFGGTLARALTEEGNQVLGVDLSEKTVQSHAAHLTKAVAADTTDPEVLEQLGVREIDHVVVGIGDIEASILTTTELVNIGVRNVWAKAMTEAHDRILKAVGVAPQHVVRPEHDAGRRVAHLVTNRMIDYIALDPEFALVETTAPSELCGKPLAAAKVRQKYGVTVVCLKPSGGSFTYAQADTVITAGDILLVAGATKDVEEFAYLD